MFDENGHFFVVHGSLVLHLDHCFVRHPRCCVDPRTTPRAWRVNLLTPIPGVNNPVLRLRFPPQLKPYRKLAFGVISKEPKHTPPWVVPSHPPRQRNISEAILTIARSLDLGTAALTHKEEVFELLLGNNVFYEAG